MACLPIPQKQCFEIAGRSEAPPLLASDDGTAAGGGIGSLHGFWGNWRKGCTGIRNSFTVSPRETTLPGALWCNDITSSEARKETAKRMVVLIQFQCPCNQVVLFEGLPTLRITVRDFGR